MLSLDFMVLGKWDTNKFYNKTTLFSFKLIVIEIVKYEVYFIIIDTLFTW